MKNIDKYDLLETEIKKNDLGIITLIKARTGISAKDGINFKENILLANYIYNEYSYDLVYIIIDPYGNVTESYIEEEGIHPKLFKSPEDEIYVSIIVHDAHKEGEISIPLFKREEIEKNKTGKSLEGDFAGVVNQSAVFYDVDLFSEKDPDKMTCIEFKNNLICKKQKVKFEYPQNNNKIFVNNNEIHLIYRGENNIYIHRQVDEKGNEIKRREINLQGNVFKEIIKLSFEKTSQLLTEQNGKVEILEIDKEGNYLSEELIDIKDSFLYTGLPIKIASNTFLLRFNTEFGNGWFTIKNSKLVEFYYSKNQKGYKNLLTNEVIETNYDKLIISGAVKTKDNSYAIIFYPMKEEQTKNKELVILNRSLE